MAEQTSDGFTWVEKEITRKGKTHKQWFRVKAKGAPTTAAAKLAKASAPAAPKAENAFEKHARENPNDPYAQMRAKATRKPSGDAQRADDQQAKLAANAKSYRTQRIANVTQDVLGGSFAPDKHFFSTNGTLGLRKTSFGTDEQSIVEGIKEQKRQLDNAKKNLTKEKGWEYKQEGTNHTDTHTHIFTKRDGAGDKTEVQISRHVVDAPGHEADGQYQFRTTFTSGPDSEQE